MEDLITEVKKKSELSGVPNSLIIDLINDHRKKHPFSFPLKKKDQKLIVKEIRSQLRDYVGRFKKKKSPSLLSSHTSTNERESFYKELKEIIYSSSPHSILDIGCGLNPIALAKPGVKYFASDIDEQNLKEVQKFFDISGIEGKTFIADARKDPFPQSDLTLIFKVLDIIEIKGHKKAEDLLLRLKSPRILVSFSTRKLSGKPMNRPQRYWFEKMLSRLNFPYSKFSFHNEIFYDIRKELQ